MPKITLADGSVRTYKNSISPRSLANEISQNLGKVAVAAKVNGELWDLEREINHNSEVMILTKNNEETLRHFNYR